MTTPAPRRRPAASRERTTPPDPSTPAPVQPGRPGGPADLAGSLRGLLRSVDEEVQAVGELSRLIDEHVTELNALRAEQALRLGVLDELRASVQDDSLGAFLDKAVRPRGARVEEIIPERLLET